MEKPAHRQRQTSREHTADQPPGLLWSEDCPYAADATPYERAGHLRLELLRASEGLRSTCNPQGLAARATRTSQRVAEQRGGHLC
ncbi:hypothetical protein ISCGN_002728 [Ixodes scapularis]